ncbi:P-loop NTPase family protein [Viridibacillus arvi]|uniref:hypothetical protein n=1 Tax=Viridibacillus arvi TaxID=263475 RepID=UPI0014701D4E|nr:hypothetical protein [Viridibacillus arvi]
MKTMVSTIICLASNKSVVLLDEPVLGFDAIMRTEFYDLLVESFSRNPRIIIISTHIVDEIAKVPCVFMIPYRKLRQRHIA